MQTHSRISLVNGKLGPNLEEDFAVHRLHSAMLYMEGLALGAVRSVLDAYLLHGKTFVPWDGKPE